MKKIVLIVDDDSTVSDVLALSFSVIGNVDVIKAYSGAEGIEKAIEEQPDLIIMDYKMPVMDGWEAARQIKANPQTANIPIIGYTAWAGMEDIQKGIKAGIDEIITKPTDLDSWEEKLSRYLST